MRRIIPSCEGLRLVLPMNVQVLQHVQGTNLQGDNSMVYVLRNATHTSFAAAALHSMCSRLHVVCRVTPSSRKPRVSLMTNPVAVSRLRYVEYLITPPFVIIYH